MNSTRGKRLKRIRRHMRVRASIKGTSERPRLSVFRSNRAIVVQLIDDVHGKTLVHATDQRQGETKGRKSAKKETPTARAYALGERLAALAGEKNILAVVFDRGGYTYHGRVKSVADGARKGGLQL